MSAKWYVFTLVNNGRQELGMLSCYLIGKGKTKVKQFLSRPGQAMGALGG